MKCHQELCPNWSGDGEVCPCAIFDLDRPECTCYRDCRQDSHSGDWHTHEGEPCPLHPDAVMVG